MEQLPFPDDSFQLVLFSAEESLPPLAFDPFLYLRPAHIAHQHGPNGQMFVLLKDGKGVGVFPFFQEDEQVFSPWRAPFGGVQFSEKLPEEVKVLFLKQLQEFLLKEKGIKAMKWLQCPDVYSPETSRLLREKLPGFGYALLSDQLNHHLPVTPAPFEEVIHVSAKRRLQKCLRLGFTVQQESIERLPEAYALLKHCRQEKQKPLSLSFEQLHQYFQLFPEQYRLFTVRRKEELAAVGVTVQINRQILNHLYPASPTVFNAYSPTVLLTKGIYEFCQQQQIKVLDLGVSAPPDEPEKNYEGLFTFKERLGGQRSWKPAFLFNERNLMSD